MTECEEVALNMPLPLGLVTMDDFRRWVRGRMDETETVIDNVAEALWLRAQQEAKRENPKADSHEH